MEPSEEFQNTQDQEYGRNEEVLSHQIIQPPVNQTDQHFFDLKAEEMFEQLKDLIYQDTGVQKEDQILWLKAPSKEIEIYDTNEFKPGLYTVLTENGIDGSKGPSKQSGKENFYPHKSVLEIIQTKFIPAEYRIRGQIKDSLDWVSILDTETDTPWMNVIDPLVAKKTKKKINEVILDVKIDPVQNAKKSSKKCLHLLFALTIGVLLILLGISSYYIDWRPQEKIDLNTTVSTLTASVTALTDEKSAKDLEITNLNTKVSTLTASVTALTSEKLAKDGEIRTQDGERAYLTANVKKLTQAHKTKIDELTKAKTEEIDPLNDSVAVFEEVEEMMVGQYIKKLLIMLFVTDQIGNMMLNFLRDLYPELDIIIPPPMSIKYCIHKPLLIAKTFVLLFFGRTEGFGMPNMFHATSGKFGDMISIFFLDKIPLLLFMITSVLTAKLMKVTAIASGYKIQKHRKLACIVTLFKKYFHNKYDNRLIASDCAQPAGSFCRFYKNNIRVIITKTLLVVAPFALKQVITDKDYRDDCTDIMGIFGILFLWDVVVKPFKKFFYNDMVRRRIRESNIKLWYDKQWDNSIVAWSGFTALLIFGSWFTFGVEKNFYSMQSSVEFLFTMVVIWFFMMVINLDVTLFFLKQKKKRLLFLESHDILQSNQQRKLYSSKHLFTSCPSQ